MTSDDASRIVAARVREVRRKRGLTVPDLAARCAAAGAPGLTEAAIFNLEGRRSGKGTRPPRPVTVADLLALAKVLQVAPVHLIIPPDAETYTVTKDVTAPAAHVRDWIRGYGLLPGDDPRLYLAEVPRDEFEESGGVLFPRYQPWQLRQAQREQATEKGNE